MDSRYKLIISNKNLYKEIELTPDMSQVKVGTSTESEIRLRKELFFSPIELTLQKTNDGWTILCSDNLYFSMGDIRKLLTKKLVHGEEFALRYQESDNEVFVLSFMIDFDYEKKDYNIEIDIQGQKQIKIGGTNDCDIYFKDTYLGKDFLILANNGKWVLKDNNSKYGVFVNGVKITKQQEIKDYDFFSIVGFSFYYRCGKLYTSDKNNMKISGLSSRTVDVNSTNLEYPKFNRNTRIQYVIPEENIEIKQAVQKPAKPKRNIIITLIPSIIMLAMTIVLRGIMGGGGTFVIYSAISMGLGIVMSVVSFIQENKEYKKEYAERIERYEQYIAEKKALIEESRSNELRIRNQIYEELENSIKEVDEFGKRLFERELEDKDFLKVYLGKGRVESVNQVKYDEQEFVDLEDPLATLPKTTAEQYRYIENAPIISDFKNSCGVGIVGKKEFLEQMLTNITLDISIRHFYNDVKLVYILDEDYFEKVKWIRWLHNVDNQKIDVKNIVCDEESKNIILEDLYNILSSRESILSEHKETAFEEQYVVFVTDVTTISTHPLFKYVKNCVGYGFTFVFLEEYEERLPQGCTEIIHIKDGSNGLILKSENGDEDYTFTYPTISSETAENVALKMGAIMVDEISLEGELTKNISMFELLNILSVDDLDLNERWNKSVVYKSLAAPLGVKNKNEIVCLDISDKSGAHGPHGLVAGTTGSGKSEILQTYILSIATLYHPYEVGFVIIDFKGGGMANQFKNLPHLIGTITNIDGREINRSLLSIKAELIKRQEMFSECGVNHINDYIKLFKENKVTVPMPHLIMIVDEFAELKAEYPEFMKELISAARIGRTLGIHLILATQKPSGVVDSQIWSNSKFKLCLKVQTKEDSNEVIKTPLAAEIVEPGRAYFQVGNNEIFELFQSAYSGANIPEGNDNTERVYNIYEKNIWGKKTVKYTNKKSKTSKKSISQLQAIVDYVNDYCVESNIMKLPGICLPSLKDRIETEELVYYKNTDNVIVAPIGTFDDPEQQRQEQINLELSKENVYIIGSSQSGKTVMLQTIIYGLIRSYTPKEVNLYLIDCGSMVLKIFENSAHVGGVVLSNEYEKCQNLFKLLNTFVMQRKQILSGMGIGNYSAYLEAGYTDLPLVVVMIDNMAAFKEYFPDEAEAINSLAREAQGVGISFVITAVNANALSYKVQSNFAKKLALNCNDANDYNALFGRCKMTPKEVPGRGLCLVDKRVLEYQTAIFGHSKKEADRSKELVQFIENRNAELDCHAIKIPMIPDKLSLAESMANEVQLYRNSCVLPIGMDFATIEYQMMDFRAKSMLALVGNALSRKVFTQNLLHMIARNVVFHNVEMTIIDEKTKELAGYQNHGFVNHYVSDAAEALSVIEEYCDVAELLLEENEATDCKVLVINSVDAMKRIYADRTISKRLAEIVKNGHNTGAFILFCNIENQAIGFSATDVLKSIKDEKHGILFAPLSENKVFEVSGRIKAETSFDHTMGYYFAGNTYSKIKFFNGEE